MFDAGDLIYDPRLRMAGMILHIEERTLGDKDKTIELWYNVMLFGDPWCRDGKTRDYQMNHGDNILELYNPQIHKALNIYPQQRGYKVGDCGVQWDIVEMTKKGYK